METIRMKNKSSSKIINTHTARSQKGHGDNYGTGIKNPVGKMREGFGIKNIPNSKLKTPPRSLA